MSASSSPHPISHSIDASAFQRDLLRWYDKAARRLPWRTPPGAATRPDPYAVWLSEIMLQQTTVAAVEPYFREFLSRWPTAADLAAAPEEDVFAAWAGLGYYARARNLLKCARQVAADGDFPQTEAGLLELPGVGPYTAAAIAAIAFGEAATVVDGNIERVMARLYAVETPLPAAKPELRAHAATLTPSQRPGDYAQALMDLGATICRPRNAACLACPVSVHCASSGRDPERLPRKTPKAARPLKYGIAYWLQTEDRVLLVRRPDKGLLGGMRAFPTSDFNTSLPTAVEEAPAALDWRLTEKSVSHGFTHFELNLRIAEARTDRPIATNGEFWPIGDLDAAGLPTLFAKVARAMTKE